MTPMDRKPSNTPAPSVVVCAASLRELDKVLPPEAKMVTRITVRWFNLLAEFRRGTKTGLRGVAGIRSQSDYNGLHYTSELPMFRLSISPPSRRLAIYFIRVARRYAGTFREFGDHFFGCDLQLQASSANSRLSVSCALNVAFYITPGSRA